MKLRSLFVVIIFLSSPSLFGQKETTLHPAGRILGSKIEAKTKTVKGTGPFYPGSAIVFSPKAQPEDYSGIAKLTVQRIRFFDLQPEQGAFDRYLSGETTREKALKYFGWSNTDTLRLSRQKFDHKLALLFGMDSLKNYVVIADINFNKSFSDDSVQVYPYVGDPDLEVEARKKIKPQKIKYPFFDGKKITMMESWIVIDPYRGHMSVSHQGATDSLLYLSIGYSDYKESKFVFHGKHYKVSIGNLFSGLSYSNKKRVNFIFAPEASPYVTQQNGYIPYKINDVVNLDNYQLRLDSIDTDGGQFYFTDLGYQKYPEGFLPGLYVPPFSATTIDHVLFSLRDQRKHYVLLDFWGTWCGPCIEAMPKVKALKLRYQDKPLDIIGVAYDDAREEVAEFVRKNDLDWMQVFQDRKNAKDADLVQKLKVESFPTVILIDPNGKILMRENAMEKIEAKLKEILK